MLITTTSERIRQTRATDKIFNGADDDGSGTVSVLSIAEALAKAPERPKRSVLLVWHCGEEKGSVVKTNKKDIIINDLFDMFCSFLFM